jgi:hypothetical protein
MLPLLTRMPLATNQIQKANPVAVAVAVKSLRLISFQMIRLMMHKLKIVVMAAQ